MGTNADQSNLHWDIMLWIKELNMARSARFSFNPIRFLPFAAKP